MSENVTDMSVLVGGLAGKRLIRSGGARYPSPVVGWPVVLSLGCLAEGVALSLPGSFFISRQAATSVMKVSWGNASQAEAGQASADLPLRETSSVVHPIRTHDWCLQKSQTLEPRRAPGVQVDPSA